MINTVFAKTPKGIQEVETKANRLSMMQRWVLIYADGKRTRKDFQTLPRITDLEGILAFLEDDGYITPLNTSPAGDVAFAAIPQKLSIFRELPAAFDPTKFNMAKNFMMNTLNTFQGLYGSTGLVRAIDHSQTHEELRTLFDQWYEALLTTRQGKKQGEDLRVKLLDVI